MWARGKTRNVTLWGASSRERQRAVTDWQEEGKEENSFPGESFLLLSVTKE